MRFYLLVILLTGACSPTPVEQAPHFALAVTAIRDDGKPLAGVALQVAGSDRGTTDGEGHLLIDLEEQGGARLAVVAQCPAGYREARYPNTVTLRRFRKLEEKASSEEIPVEVTCVPSERVAVLVVRADGRANLPVVVNGRELARTDRSGIAHVHLKVPRYDNLRVTLDTRAHPELQPQSPQIGFQMADADEILIFDQPFTAKDPPRPMRRPSHRKKDPDKPAAPKPTRPVKIGATIESWEQSHDPAEAKGKARAVNGRVARRFPISPA